MQMHSYIFWYSMKELFIGIKLFSLDWCSNEVACYSGLWCSVKKIKLMYQFISGSHEFFLISQKIFHLLVFFKLPMKWLSEHLMFLMLDTNSFFLAIGQIMVQHLKYLNVHDIFLQFRIESWLASRLHRDEWSAST